MRLVIELADAGLLALPEEGEAAPPSPGFAIVEGDDITIGRQAEARARLAPRHLHSRYWQDISTEALGRPFGRRLRSADLAWTHLSELWRVVGHGVSSVILALSGGRSEAQLDLILGVARSAGLPVDGMVDAAVAASVGRTTDETTLHLDLELHRAVLTILSPGPRRRKVLISDRVGLAALHDVWMRHVAGLFLKTTRYDPFHSAASEQDLYDRLPSTLNQLSRRRSATISLAANENVFTVDLTRDRMVAAADARYAEIGELIHSASAKGPSTLLLSARAASTPGLADRLAGLAALEVVRLPLAAAAAGAHRHSGQIVAPGTSLPFITDLSESATQPIETAASAASGSAKPPTHLLVGGVAHPLGDGPLWLGSAPDAGDRGVAVGAGESSIRRRHCVIRSADGRVSAEDLSNGSCALNDQPMGAVATLEAGDRLRLGTPGVEIMLFAVAP